ncbi:MULTISPECIES: BolA family protein [Shewanella]|uniref:BolA family protein n=1 Tax=Shewanella seohaensis TaxID=755175 RepID=A0ABV4VR43_9GAMM|nr:MULTISPECIES: BolA family protein [unclassified Shewanella]QXN24168.1 BolA family transcriptional regulator [Shewanella putrefaciens]ABI38012.1 transcriptional regulator BolA [Shewanella sp. MR-4]KPN78031.1 transcriptional regulator [Shewanella sp. Sh95]MDH1469277.1 BolA family transcriptional regulator [Shewanella sp. GD03713]VEE62987.1 transcriptional regulator BolA [Shewanella putrefaciens]
MSNTHAQGTVAQTIDKKLTESFSPTHLEVLNESHRHHVPPNSETHFKVVVVSDEFEGLRLLARHRLVNNCLADELANGVHALSIHTFTQSEWAKDVEVPKTPNCRG